MIISFIFLLAGFFIGLIAQALTALNYIPQITGLFSAVNYFLGYTAIFSGVIDLPAVFAAASVAITFEIFWFVFLIAWYIIGFVRAIFTRGNAH